MARIPYFDVTQASGPIKDELARRPALNIYRMAAHGGPVGAAFMRMAAAILYESSLEPARRELLILRVGAHHNARYELNHHRRIALSKGVSQAQIDALMEPGRFAPAAGLFDPEAIDLIRFADEMVERFKTSDQAFSTIDGRYSEQIIVEIILIVGFYQMVCAFLENLEIDLEDPAHG